MSPMIRCAGHSFVDGAVFGEAGALRMQPADRYVPSLRYCCGVQKSLIPRDTSPHVHALMMARFASMTIGERAEAAQELNDMCTTIAIAGIRAQHGDVSDDDLRWHLAARRYGRSLADDAYGPR